MNSRVSAWLVQIIALLAAGLLLAACQSATDSSRTGGQTGADIVSPVTNNVAVAARTAPEGQVSFQANGNLLRINKPADWESFPTEYGIVIGERFGSVATAGVLEGVMTYVFVTPLDDFTLQVAEESNLARTMLDEILRDPIYTANIAYTPTFSFTWDGFDAAYYLLSGEDGNATIVIGIAVPDRDVLLSCSVSAPYPQRERIRDLLPELLDGLTLNQTHFAGGALTSLPDPLIFPEYKPREG